MAETQERPTHEVVVHKASVPLKKGESLQQFTQAVRDAGRGFIQQKLNLSDPNKADVYAIEIFAGSAVFDVFMFGTVTPPNKKQRYFAVAYTRNKKGDFEFSNMTEVERTVSFRAKPQGVPVTKAAEVDGSAGWTGVHKASAALWNGVI